MSETAKGSKREIKSTHSGKRAERVVGSSHCSFGRALVLSRKWALETTETDSTFLIKASAEPGGGGTRL